MTHEQEIEARPGDPVSVILEAWRQAERQLVAMGTDGDRRSVEARIARLRGEYQRRVEPQADEAAPAGVGARLTLGSGMWPPPPVRAARDSIAAGLRPWFRALSARQPDGAYRVSVGDLPGVTVRVMSRKGVEATVRARIALVLDVPESSFDVTVVPTRR